MKEKHVIITNGSGTVGKDTVFNLMSKYMKCTKYSSIDTIKNISRLFGCDGKKTERNRKLWHDLKEIAIEYNDMPFEETCTMVKSFKNDLITGDALVIDIREPYEIAKIKDVFDGIITVLIMNDNVEKIESNAGDANVLDYTYDYIIDNSGTLEDLDKSVKYFIDNFLN